MNRKKITKAERQQVYEKYGGHCAYCGKEIEIKDMQVDHMIPLRLGGDDEMANYMPACRQCNHYKRGNSLEGFRKMIERIPEKLERDSYIYGVGVNYKNVIPNKRPIVFYFEAVGERNVNKDAIETIKIAVAEVEWNYPMDYAIAFEAAIEALEKQKRNCEDCKNADYVPSINAIYCLEHCCVMKTNNYCRDWSEQE